MDLLTLFIFALTLGLWHAFEADHIAAVSALATDAKRGALLGFFWGVGHTAILLVAGVVVLLLGVTIPETFSNIFELLAGVLLLLLGFSALRRSREAHLHLHSHTHGGEEHIHVHSHQDTTQHRHEHHSFFFGVLHGLAGSGALLLIVLPTSESLITGLLFILVFGFGSMCGMSLVSFFLVRAVQYIGRWKQLLHYGVAIFSVVIGITMIQSGLF